MTSLRSDNRHIKNRAETKFSSHLREKRLYLWEICEKRGVDGLAAGPPMEMLIRSEIIQRKEEGCDVSRAEERLSELVEGTE